MAIQSSTLLATPPASSRATISRVAIQFFSSLQAALFFSGLPHALRAFAMTGDGLRAFAGDGGCYTVSNDGYGLHALCYCKAFQTVRKDGGCYTVSNNSCGFKTLLRLAAEADDHINAGDFHAFGDGGQAAHLDLRPVDVAQLVFTLDIKMLVVAGIGVEISP